MRSIQTKQKRDYLGYVTDTRECLWHLVFQFNELKKPRTSSRQVLNTSLQSFRTNGNWYFDNLDPNPNHLTYLSEKYSGIKFEKCEVINRWLTFNKAVNKYGPSISHAIIPQTIVGTSVPVIGHGTGDSTPALVAIFYAKIPETILVHFSSTLVNYGGKWVGQICLVNRVLLD